MIVLPHTEECGSELFLRRNWRDLRLVDMLKDLVPPESASKENTCAGCGSSIKDRYGRKEKLLLLIPISFIHLPTSEWRLIIIHCGSPVWPDYPRLSVRVLVQIRITVIFSASHGLSYDFLLAIPIDGDGTGWDRHSYVMATFDHSTGKINSKETKTGELICSRQSAILLINKRLCLHYRGSVCCLRRLLIDRQSIDWNEMMMMTTMMVG